MPLKIQDILANAQALAQQIAAYAASLNPGTPIPQNIASALVAVQSAQSTLNTDAAATPFVLSTVATDVANLLAAVQALSSAVASPSNP